MTTPSSGVERQALVRCPFCETLNRMDLSRLSDGPKCGGCHRPLLLDRPIAITDQDFERVLAGTTVPVLVDFYADWCGPCKMMAPTLDQLAHDRAGDVMVMKLNTDRNPVMPQRFDIRGIPTLIAFRDGQETGRHVGLATAAQLDVLLPASA